METEFQPKTTVSPDQTGLLAPFRVSKNFTALWTGQTLSQFGDILLGFMLPLIVLDLTASTLAMGTIMMLAFVPKVILVPFTGLFVDRFNRVQIMIWSDIVRLILLALLTVMSAMDALTMPLLYLFAVINGAMGAVFYPAYAAVRAQVFTPDIRNAANSLTQSSMQIVKLVGPSLSGLLLGVTTYTIGLGIDALTFLISILGLLLLTVKPPARQENQTWSLRSFLHDLLGGYYELRKHAWLWVTILIFCVINMASSGIVSVLIPWLIKIHLGWDAVSFGLVMSASGVGALIAAFLYGRKSVWKKRGIMAYTAISLSGVALFGMAFADNLPLLILLSALEGASVMIFGLIWEITLQELVPEEAFGRVASLDMFGSIALMPVGFYLTGLLAELYGGLNVMIAEGVLVAVLAASMLAVPAIRKFQ